MPLLASRSARLASATGALLLAGLAPLTLPAGEESVASPDGRIVVTVGDQERTLGAGEAYYFRSRIPHRFRNPFDEVCEVISANTPPSF